MRINEIMVTTFIGCSLLLLLASSTATAFSLSQLPSYQRAARITTIASPTRLFGTQPQARKERPQRNNDDEEDGLAFFEKARILSYRTALGASALLVSFEAIGDSSFLEGTGVDADGLVELSTSVLPLVAGATLATCPVPRIGFVEIGAVSLAALTSGCGVAASIIASQEPNPGLQAVSWSLSVLALMAVSIREIWYFGGEYKRECGINLFVLPLMLDINNRIPFALPLCAVGMSVLAAGKIFEPLGEDLKRSNSEFLAK